jgi:hypothetical protein
MEEKASSLQKVQQPKMVGANQCTKTTQTVAQSCSQTPPTSLLTCVVFDCCKHKRNMVVVVLPTYKGHK